MRWGDSVTDDHGSLKLSVVIQSARPEEGLRGTLITIVISRFHASPGLWAAGSLEKSVATVRSAIRENTE
jgi:hypothetical protein